MSAWGLPILSQLRSHKISLVVAEAASSVTSSDAFLVVIMPLMSKGRSRCALCRLRLRLEDHVHPVIG